MEAGAISLGRLAAPPAPDAGAASAGRVATEFEAMVLAQFLAPLFASVETPGLAGGGAGEKAFQSLLQEEYAKAIAARGGFGVADQVKRALIAMQAAGPDLAISNGE